MMITNISCDSRVAKSGEGARVVSFRPVSAPIGQNAPVACIRLVTLQLCGMGQDQY